ncbi:Homeodomain-like protein [Elsinoe ampelina]|uniref:Homeodomain-like protein n=1 Tax=Elsinoe ampelina TaxID=302913 RepID=A0A6A6GBZ1_9PEZI|nr:Homeodomain-like protein [Elsinoe ampelina]
MDTRAVKRSRPAPKAAVEKLPHVKRTARVSPRDAPVDSFDVEPAPKHRRKVSRTTPTPREDMDYRKIPDYSPPVDSMLPGKNLKIDWKGHPLDLSDDPDRYLLDEHEITLASVLRLTGAQYLFAKRRIFEKFVELARTGKDLNKTSAQAVCKIDVNKASKLWTAFEKVGWFDKKHIAQYLK